MFYELIKNEAVRFAEWLSLFHYTGYPYYENNTLHMKWCNEQLDPIKFYTTEELYKR